MSIYPITPGTVLFGAMNGINQTFPSLLPNALKATETVIQAASHHGDNAFALTPVSFKFPADSHPLAELAGAILSFREKKSEPTYLVGLLRQSFRLLDATSSTLFSCPNIQLVKENLNHFEQALTLIDNSADKPTLEKYLNAVLNRGVRNLLAGHIYDISKDPHKGGDDWGLIHMFEDLQCLKEAIVRLIDRNCTAACHDRIKEFALAKLTALPNYEKNAIYASVYHIAGRPKTTDSQWGEHAAVLDIKRLISSLHCHAKIGGPLHTGYYLKNWEKGHTVSRYFCVDGNELNNGEIGFINGMGSSFEKANQSAQKIHATHLQGFALHCVYAATQGAWDLPSALIGQNLNLLPQGKLLIQRWTEFFARSNPDHRYLQICTSRGAIDVAAALATLPQNLKERIIVIAIGPGYIIEPGSCYRAVNLVVKEDPVPYLAPNHHLIEQNRGVRILPNHSDGANAHSPHGSSYREVVSVLVDKYIRTNNLID